MTRIRILLVRFFEIFHRRKLERELEAEIQSHLEMQADDNVRAGMNAADARQAALKHFGGVDQIKETCRDHRGMRLIDILVQDLRYAIRRLRSSPAFTLVAVSTLAIGIGSATASFTQINAVYWKTPSVKNPEQLRNIGWKTNLSSDYSRLYSYPAYQLLSEHTKSFSDVAIWRRIPSPVTEWGPVWLQLVSGNYFRTLGVNAIRGRTLTTFDDQPGKYSPVAVVSYGFWQRSFGGEPNILGRTITLSGVSFQVVGVLPHNFMGLDPISPADVMVPFGAEADLYKIAPTNWSAGWVVARLAPKVSEQQMRTETETLFRDAFLAQHPGNAEKPQFVVTDMWNSDGQAFVRHRTAFSLLLLFAVTTAILLITCANFAGLLLVRGRTRHKEVATRIALGANRGRVIRQLLTENFLLSVIGGGLGTALAYGLSSKLPVLMTRLVGGFSPDGLDPTIGVDATPDLRVLVFSISATVITGFLLGLLPALLTTRVNLISTIKQASLMGVPGRSRFFAGNITVAFQVALSMLLLVGAGLFIRTLLNLEAVPLGYDPEGLAFVMTVSNPTARVVTPEALRALEQIPGVTSVALSAWPLANNPDPKTPVCIPSRHAEDHPADVVPVSRSFFETWGVHLLSGRDFVSTSESGAIVNQTFAKTFFPDDQPLGQTIGIGRCPGLQRTIVGIVADHKDRQRMQISPMVYQPYPIDKPVGAPTFSLRTKGDPQALIPAVRRIMTELNATLIGDVTTGNTYKSINQKQERLLVGLLIFFSVLGLFISCLGLYGLLAYIVSCRTSEIGVRMALGAGRLDLIRLVAGESLFPVAGGIAFGLIAIFASARWLENMLFGVAKTDPWTIGSAAFSLMVVSVFAAIGPARRALHMECIRALRSE